MIVPVQDETPFSPFLPGKWETALHTVKEAGYDGVELAITDPNRLNTAVVKEVLESEGLRLLSITTGQAAAKEGLSLSSPDEKIRRRAVERIQAHMQFAKSFGAVVIVGSLRGADGDMELLVESLRECATSNAEVRIALEPLNRYESRLVNTAAEALSVVERVGVQNLGLLLDTFHANIEERNIGQACRDAGERLFHIHLADSNRWILGYGHLSFVAVWETLEASDYDGSLVIEALPYPNTEKLLASAETIRSQWA
jgi:sugar phosphate isomerase/epimerase